MPNKKNRSNPNQCLQKIVEKAISSFNSQESYLIENDLSERCICARFAMHLTTVLKDTPYSGYTVDVEYNRGNKGEQHSAKRLCDKPITVDLIVHKRGYDPKHGFNNLICIEMKKTTNRFGCADDEARLKKLVTDEYGFCYRAGFMILIDTKNPHLGLKIKESFFLPY